MARRSAERTTYRVQVLERAVDILQVLSEDSRELAAGEVAERLSLHKSTIHRLLSVLDQHRLIRRNAETGRYALGLRLFESGSCRGAGSVDRSGEGDRSSGRHDAPERAGGRQRARPRRNDGALLGCDEK